MTIPKIAVLATGLTAGILVATIHPTPAQAFPSTEQNCTNCHGVLAGTVTATPSTTTPAAGATYTVTITMPANAAGGNTGYWIANSDAAGVTGTSTGVTGGVDGSFAMSYTRDMTAPGAAGTYYYKVWADKGPRATGVTNFALYNITVAAPPTTTPPPTTTTTPPPTTTTTTPPPTTTTTPPPTTTTTTPPPTTTTTTTPPPTTTTTTTTPPPTTTTTTTTPPPTTTTTTTVPPTVVPTTIPPVVAPAVVPVGAPATGAGGAAQSNGSPLMGFGGLALLLSGAAMVTAIRRRRQV